MLAQELNTRFDEWRQLISIKELDNEALYELVEQESNGDVVARNRLRNIIENRVRCICDQRSEVRSKGEVEFKIKYKDGKEQTSSRYNTILQKGKIALAKSLTSEVENPYDFYVESMIFGTNGTSGSSPRYVDESRTALFGTTLLTKNVISSRDEAAPTTAIFTSVITFDEGNGSALNEMALKLGNDDLYSMLTFPDINKTSSMELTINWYVSFL